MAGSRLSKHSLLLFATALVLAGCPDPEGRFDEFTDRTAGDRGIGGSGGGMAGGVADVNGTFFLGIDTVINRGKILRFDTAVTINVNPDGTCPAEGCLMGWEVQPVVPDPKPRSNCPDPGTPVGDLIVLTDIPVGNDGSFIANFGQQTVDGCANPISGGNILANLILTGNILGPDAMCGKVSGTVSQPVTGRLDGSDFGMFRINEGEFPAPAPNCAAVMAMGGGTGGSGGTGGTGGSGGEAGSGGTGGTAG